MKKIYEVIGTGDLFAEIAKVKRFSAFDGYDTSDLNMFFITQHGERWCDDCISSMTLEQIAKLVVITKGDVIDNITKYSNKYAQSIDNAGNVVTVHTQTTNGTNDSTQKVVPHNLTEMRDKSSVNTLTTGTTEDRTETTKDFSNDDKMNIFTNSLICDIFAIIANAISLYIYME